MGIKFSKSVDQDGDDEALSPITNSRSLLGTDPNSNATRRITVDDDHLLQVSVVKDLSSAGIGTKLLNKSSIVGVTDNTLTTVVSYVITSLDKGITKVSCSGTAYAKFSLVINTVTIEYKRSGPSRNIDFGPLGLNTGDIVDIKVEHFNTGSTADFDASIYGV